MRTMKKTLATFSPKTVTFHFPTSWKECSQSQLREVLRSMANGKGKTEARIKLLFSLNGVSVSRRFGRYWLCVCRQSWRKWRFFTLQPWQVAWMIRQMSWIDDVEDFDARIEKAGGKDAVEKYLHGVAFREYLAMEKYYQLYLASKNEEYLRKLCTLLYPEATVFLPEEMLGGFLWFAFVKRGFAQQFPHFFRPSQGSGGEGKGVLTPWEIQEQMNVQIRALTDGDVTKEDCILNHTDCWRALTELNEKAREAKERKQELERMKRNGRH